MDGGTSGSYLLTRSHPQTPVTQASGKLKRGSLDGYVELQGRKLGRVRLRHVPYASGVSLAGFVADCVEKASLVPSGWKGGRSGEGRLPISGPPPLAETSNWQQRPIQGTAARNTSRATSTSFASASTGNGHSTWARSSTDSWSSSSYVRL